jgi:hypothetical protein
MLVEQSNSAGRTGKYSCTRCGWAWTPRLNSPDPPRACARCRSAYWHSAPASSRANTPNDPKWQVERESIARRKRERHLTRLKELAAEFGLKLPPVLNNLTIAPPIVPVQREFPQPAAIAVDPRVRFNEPVPPPLDPTASSPPAPRRSLGGVAAPHRAIGADVLSLPLGQPPGPNATPKMITADALRQSTA